MSAERLKQALNRVCGSKIDWDTPIFRQRVFVRSWGKCFCEIIAPAKSKILVILTFSGLNLMIRVVDVPNQSLISGEFVKNRIFSSPQNQFGASKIEFFASQTNLARQNRIFRVPKTILGIRLAARGAPPRATSSQMYTKTRPRPDRTNYLKLV